MDYAKAVLTANRKTGPVYVTHAAQASCPDSCPFLKSGCYAESGPQGIWTKRMNDAASSAKVTDMDVAMAEAAAIRTLPDDRPLRLHIVGDCRTDKAAATVSAAADERSQPTWAYTHAWRTVDRASWGRVNVLASCETDADVAAAYDRGYAACRVVNKHDGERAKRDAQGMLNIPCPEQTGRSTSCIDCRLCWNADALRNRKAVIVFAAHGATKKIAAALAASEAS